jgi:hypothetical protein
MLKGTKPSLAEADWNAVKAEIRAILIRVAQDKQLITYSELTAMLQAAYIHHHSHVLARLLVEVGMEEAEAGRAILPALVVAKQTGIPGKGFFRIAGERGLAVSDPLAYWSAEVQRVYAQWERPAD